MNDKKIWLLLLAIIPLYFLMGQSNPSTNAITGQWTLELIPQGVQFSIHRTWDGHNNYSSSSSYDLDDFRGLTRARVEAGGSAKFDMLRDAGTLSCEGSFRNGGGGGTFVFAPNPEYVSALRSLGYSNLDAERLFELAVHNVSRAYIRELDELGYHRLPLDELVQLRIHGVSTAYIRDLRDLGYTFQPDELVQLRIHGLTAEFAATLKKSGYGTLAADQLVQLQIHGVTSEYMKGFHDMGYPRIPVDDLVQLRIHGVTTEFVNQLRGMGYGRAGVNDLVQLQIHGVSAGFVKDL